MMKAFIDEIKCETAGICVKGSPELFRFQVGSKKGQVRLEEIPMGYQRQVLELAVKCPVRAIIVSDVWSDVAPQAAH